MESPDNAAAQSHLESRIASRIDEIRGRIAAAAKRSGREPAQTRLMAVSKTQPVQAVKAALKAGISLFGENRVQEAMEKFPPVFADYPQVKLELLGHLQTNKAKKAAAFFSRIQSLDSLELMLELDKRYAALLADQAGNDAPHPQLARPRRLELLLELHTGEESKSGFRDLDALRRACEAAAGLDAVKLRGLMTMAPFTDEEGPIRLSFQSLRGAAEKLRREFGLGDFDVLSMGMSNDFEIAVEEGSTLLRIGTGIFGGRDA